MSSDGLVITGDWGTGNYGGGPPVGPRAPQRAQTKNNKFIHYMASLGYGTFGVQKKFFFSGQAFSPPPPLQNVQ